MITTYYKNLLAGNIWRSATTPAIPSTLYIGLSRTLPNLDGTGAVEPSGNAYARVAFSGANLTAPADGLVSNNATLSFTESTGVWGQVKYYFIADAPTGGNILTADEIPVDDPEHPYHYIAKNYSLQFAAGNLKFKVTDALATA